MGLNGLAHLLARAIEASSIAVIVLGALLASIGFLARLAGRADFDTAFRRYRTQLGRSILIGLELLVAADIIGTIAVAPTFASLSVLGLIVLIRTFLSFALEVEIEGRWPWSRSGGPPGGG